jgi:hypothetical protein
MVKFIPQEVYDFIVKANKETLTRMQGELKKEIDQGILTEPRYQKELDLINSRLTPTK